MIAVPSGKMQDAPIKGHEHQAVVHSQTQQEGIGNLIVAEKPLENGGAEGTPVRRDRLVAIPRLFGEALQHCGSLTHGHTACLGPGHVAQKSRLGKGAQRPLKTRRVKPLRYPSMMDVILIEESDQRVDIEQTPGGFSQDRPPRLASPSPV